MKGFSFKKNILWKFLLTTSFCLLSFSEALAVPKILVPPSPFKGLNGLNFDSKGQLYVGSVPGQRIYRVDIETGKFDVLIDRPQGQADDFFFTANGNIFYTSLLEGKVRSFNLNTGDFATVASDIPLVNPIVQNQDGRVFVAQSLSPNTTGLFEIDLMGVNPPRLVLNKPGLNAFAFGPDGLLYSPGQFTGEVIKINVDTGVSEQVTTGLVNPVAVKFNSKAELFALDTATGQVLRVNRITGQTQSIAQLQPGLDNLAFAPNNLLYVSNFVE